MNGSNQYSGRVEVFNSNRHYTHETHRTFALQWGTICDSDWNETDANVVCRSLGYQTTGAIAHPGGTFGAGEGPIWANNVTCVGPEFYAVDCRTESRYNYGGEAKCDHTTDVGVTCLGIYKLCTCT